MIYDVRSNRREAKETLRLWFAKHIAKLTPANGRVMARTKCVVKITRKYFVASLRITPNKPGTANCRIGHRQLAARAKLISDSSLSCIRCNPVGSRELRIPESKNPNTVLAESRCSFTVILNPNGDQHGGRRKMMREPTKPRNLPRKFPRPAQEPRLSSLSSFSSPFNTLSASQTVSRGPLL